MPSPQGAEATSPIRETLNAMLGQRNFAIHGSEKEKEMQDYKKQYEKFVINDKMKAQFEDFQNEWGLKNDVDNRYIIETILIHNDQRKIIVEEVQNA